MELLREEELLRETNVQTEKEKHNARISEHYQKLLNAVSGQIAEDNVSSEAEEKIYNTKVANENVYISPNSVNAADFVRYEQTPRVTEFTSGASSALFTADKFQQMNAHVSAQTPSMMTIPYVAPAQVAETIQEEQYSLTKSAKIVMATFAVAIVGMLSLIGANTYAINQKKMNIEALETRKAELVEMNEAVQQRIDNATSEETIRQYAESQGMIKSNE